MAFCKIVPEVLDKEGLAHPSLFFREMLSITGDRELTKQHYSIIKDTDFKNKWVTSDMMDPFGEIKLHEYLKLLGIKKGKKTNLVEEGLRDIVTDTKSVITNIEKAINVTDRNGNKIVFGAQPSAYYIANNYNTQGPLNSKFVALIVTTKSYDRLTYTIKLVPKNKSSQSKWKAQQRNSNILKEVMEILSRSNIQVVGDWSSLQSAEQVVDINSGDLAIDAILAIKNYDTGEETTTIKEFYSGFGEFVFSFIKDNPLYDRMVSICKSPEYQKFIWGKDYDNFIQNIPEEYKNDSQRYIAVKTAGKIIGDVLTDRATYEHNNIRNFIQRILKNIVSLFKNINSRELLDIQKRVHKIFDEDLKEFRKSFLEKDAKKTLYNRSISSGESRTAALYDLIDALDTQFEMLNRFNIKLPADLIKGRDDLLKLRDLTRLDIGKINTINNFLKLSLKEIQQLEVNIHKYNSELSYVNLQRIKDIYGSKYFWKSYMEKTRYLYQAKTIASGYEDIVNIIRKDLNNIKIEADIKKSIRKDIKTELNISLAQKDGEKVLTKEAVDRINYRLTTIYGNTNITNSKDATADPFNYSLEKFASFRKIDLYSPLSSENIEKLLTEILTHLGMSVSLEKSKEAADNLQNGLAKLNNSLDTQIEESVTLFAETISGTEYIGDPANEILIKDYIKKNDKFLSSWLYGILSGILRRVGPSANSIDYLTRLVDQAAKMYNQEATFSVENFKRELKARIDSLDPKFQDLKWIQELVDVDGNLERTGRFLTPGDYSKFKKAEELFKQSLVEKYGMSFQKLMIEKKVAREAYYKWKKANTMILNYRANNQKDAFITKLHKDFNITKEQYVANLSNMKEYANKLSYVLEYEKSGRTDDPNIEKAIANYMEVNKEGFRGKEDDGTFRHWAIAGYIKNIVFSNKWSNAYMFTKDFEAYIRLERSLLEWTDYFDNGNTGNYTPSELDEIEWQNYSQDLLEICRKAVNISNAKIKPGVTKDMLADAGAVIPVKIPKTRDKFGNALYNSETYDKLEDDQKLFLEWLHVAKLEFDAMINAKTNPLLLPQVWATNIELGSNYQLKDLFNKTLKNSFTSIEGDNLEYFEKSKNTDLDGNEIYTMPTAYVTKMKDTRLLTNDIGFSMTAYAQMATKHLQMQKIVFAAELGASFLKKKYSGGSMTKQYKDIKENVLKGYRDAVDRQVYGVTQRVQKLGKVSLNKMTKSASAYSRSLVLWGDINLPIINTSTGFWEIFKETLARQQLDYKSITWAVKKLGVNSLLDLGEFANNLKNSELALFRSYFDFEEQWGRNNLSTEFNRKKGINAVLNIARPALPQELSNTLLSNLCYLSKLKFEKVILDGKKISLYDAFEKINDGKTSFLKLKEGVTDLNGKKVDQEYINRFKVKVNDFMIGMFGTNDMMNKSKWDQYWWGKLVLMMKGWAVGGIERSMGLKKFNIAQNRYTVGYWNSTIKSLFVLFELLYNSVKKESSKSFWETIAPVEDPSNPDTIRVDNEYKNFIKSNYIRATSSAVIQLGLLLAVKFTLSILNSRANPDDDDEDEEFAYNYSIKDRNKIDGLGIFTYFLERSFREQAALSPMLPMYMYQEWSNLTEPNSAALLGPKKIFTLTKDVISQDREQTGNAIINPNGETMIAPYDKKTKEFDLWSSEFINLEENGVPEGYRIVREYKWKNSLYEAIPHIPSAKTKRLFFDNEADKMLREYLIGKYTLK